MTVGHCLLGTHDRLAGTLALLATLSPSAPVINHTCTALTAPTDEALCLAVPCKAYNHSNYSCLP